MANTKSAKKSIRVAVKNKTYNAARSRKLKDSIKDISEVVKFKSKEASMKAVSLAQKQIDKSLKLGRIAKNKANRMKRSIVKIAKSKV